MKKFIWLTALLIALLVLPAAAQAGDGEKVPARYTLGVGYVSMIDPSDARDFAMIFVSGLYDYDAVWPHTAPEPLFFRVEGGLGFSAEGESLHATGNVFAVYYLDGLFNTSAASTFRPYAEGGVGLIYRDYKVDGQGLRVNFSPQAGVGADIRINEELTSYISVRLHHASNAFTNPDNRGSNGVMFQMGLYF